MDELPGSYSIASKNTILSDGNTYKYNSAQFRQAKTDTTLVRKSPPGSLVLMM
jgi:hypothetical protein